MSGIQLILLTGVVFISLYFVIRLKKKTLDLALLLVMITGAVVFILRPELTTRLAEKLGVGRGADLIFYLSILIFWFVILKLYARIRQLEKSFTQIIREDALKKASGPDNQPDTTTDARQLRTN
jgi:small membrane protein